MRFDLSPLYRSTVGFDSLASRLDQVAAFDEATTYPPYNIERVTENEYCITMAVAGFGKEDVEIEVKENTLSIRGEKKEADTERDSYTVASHPAPSCAASSSRIMSR
jgi:molecular chaperone IbpA